jgi:hypothetical protein
MQLLSTRQAWAIFVGKILTDPVWWFYLYWLPGLLNRRYGLPIGRIGAPGCDLQHVGHWKHLRRMAARQVLEPGLERETGPGKPRC